MQAKKVEPGTQLVASRGQHELVRQPVITTSNLEPAGYPSHGPVGTEGEIFGGISSTDSNGCYGFMLKETTLTNHKLLTTGCSPHSQTAPVLLTGLHPDQSRLNFSAANAWSRIISQVSATRASTPVAGASTPIDVQSI